MNDKKGEENIFRTEILPEQEFYSEKLKKKVKGTFDPDSSPKAWKHYEQYYMKNFEEADFEKNTHENYDKKYTRWFSKAGIDGIEFEIAGDCSFNFNEKKSKYPMTLLRMTKV